MISVNGIESNQSEFRMLSTPNRIHKVFYWFLIVIHFVPIDYLSKLDSKTIIALFILIVDRMKSKTTKNYLPKLVSMIICSIVELKNNEQDLCDRR